MTECREISISYEEHLAHQVDHFDFLCVYCGKFNPYGMKYHMKHCAERSDDEELEADIGIQDKPKMQVEEADIDIVDKPKMQQNTSGLYKNKQKGK